MAVDSSIQELQKTLGQFKNARTRLESEWYLNIAYYYGDQWIFWNRGRIDRPKLEDWRVTLVDNRILPVAFSRISRKVKNRPTFVVTPNSFDEDDLVGAEIGGKVLEDDWINLQIQHKLFNALMWAEVVSAGFWKIYWDKTKGEYSEEYVVDPEGQVFSGQQSGRPIRANTPEGEAVLGIDGFNTKSISQGNCQIDVLSPFHFYPDPLPDELEDCEIIFEEHIRSPEYIEKHYNETLQPDTNIPVGIAESRMFPYLSDSSGGSGEYRGITVYEMYAKPSSKWGNEGKRAVWAKDKMLLESTQADAPFEGCPYVMFRGVDVPGRFWPTSITSQLRGPQTELNKIESQIRENALRIGNPSLAVARQVNTSYTGLPGEVVKYDATVPDALPQYLQPPEMPVYVQQEVERIERSITEISGLHEVSKANVPAGVTAASAINLLMEADETRIGPEIEQMESVLGQAGTKILKLRAKYQDDQRTIRMAGEDGEWDITQFRGAMLKENTNVEVQAGSAMPKMKAAKQAAMQEMLALMLQYGVEIKSRDLRKFLREFGVGGLESMFAGLSSDELQIRREHNYMKSGVPIDINDFDDHEFHIEAHDEFRKSKSYFNADDAIKNIFNKHVQAHQEQRVEMINQQVAEQKRMMAEQAQMEAQNSNSSQSTTSSTSSAS